MFLSTQLFNVINLNALVIVLTDICCSAFPRRDNSVTAGVIPALYFCFRSDHYLRWLSCSQYSEILLSQVTPSPMGIVTTTFSLSLPSLSRSKFCLLLLELERAWPRNRGLWLKFFLSAFNHLLRSFEGKGYSL